MATKKNNILFSLLILCVSFFSGSKAALASLPNAVDGQPLPTLAPMLERVTPAVVNIATSGKVVQQSPLFNDPFFRRFFDLPEQPRERIRRGLGSGVIFDAKNGFIVTNNHVIEKADDIVVTLTDGRKFDATVIGADSDVDIAIIQIKAEDLMQLETSDSDKLRVGDFVVAIGNPFGLGQTVTSGIVSATGRDRLGINAIENYIQTDASINQGNSGGALVNLRGELIGINTAILGPSGGNVGIGFAIPVNMMQQIATQLIKYGEVKRGRLGFNPQDLTPELAEAFGIEQSSGVVVARVEKGSPADKAGLRAGDVITAINGDPVNDRIDLRNVIGLIRVDTEIELDIVRNGKEKRLHAKIAEKKFQTIAGKKLSPKLDGALLSFSEINLRDGSNKRVIVVSKLEPGSAAAASGLRNGDLILSVNKREVTTFQEMEEAIAREPRGLLLNVQRGNRGLFLLIR